MKLSRLLPTLILLFCLEILSGQDVHYTLFNMSPLTTNPALTGAFNGTARIGGIYRGQWFTLDGDIATPSIYIDAPIIRGFRDKDWVGVGLVFLNDKAGSFNLSNTISGLSAAYHFALNDNGTTMLTLGGQYNRVGRRINLLDPFSQQNIESALGGGGLGAGQTEFDANGNTERSTSYSDINAGLMLRTQIDGESALEVGFATFHINTPAAGLRASGGGGTGGVTGSTPGDRQMTFVSHARYDRQLNEDWSIAPTVFWQTTRAGRNEIAVQGWAGRQINQDLKLNFGLGWRVGDAMQMMFGADYKDLRAAVSYDLNLSSASAITNYQGGFELSAYYIIKVYKKPELTPAILCPRF